MKSKDLEWFKVFLPIFGKSFQDEIDFLKDYLITNNIELLKKQTTFFTKYDRMLEEKPNSEKEIFDQTYSEYRRNFEQFPKIINNSLFVSSYSFLEAKLVQIIDLLSDFMDLKIKIDDLAGNSILGKSQKYFVKVADINLSQVETDFIKISDFQKIRNLIVHNDANIKKLKDKKISEQSMYNYLVQEPKIEFNADSGYFIINDYRYIDDFLNIISSLLSNLIQCIIISLENKRATV